MFYFIMYLVEVNSNIALFYQAFNLQIRELVYKKQRENLARTTCELHEKYMHALSARGKRALRILNSL